MAASSSSSSGEQQYSLRWNDFHSSILSSFRHLRDEEDFVDVTLACDSSSFTAHKVVLSACSPYFRRLLKANPCQHPIVILRDVASSDMESLLRFMYHGEVHVGQEQLAAFLKTAQMLQVRGLADVNSGAATAKIPPPPSSSGNNGSAPTTPRNPWQDNGRGDLNESGLSPPPDKRPRSYSPPLGNHIEPKTDLQESLLGQALEGGPTIHTTPTNNVQAQSTGEDSNSISDNEEDMSNNDSILNSVKTEPSDILNDSMEHHRSTFPAALLGLQGLMPGPSGIHAANQDPNYGSVIPKREEASSLAAATAATAAAASETTTQAVENFSRLYAVLRHDDSRPVCRYCGRSYSSPSNLRQHVKNVHSNWPPPDTWPQCNVCGKRCKTKHYLINHQLQAHGIHQRPGNSNQQHQSPSS
ncbi:protein abrupt-like isoform X5 [Vespa mandarinia]|uniref:protein abrupt-like isoform X5 n=1 Tax=Vespa mandarinia TaxID=7446 RepID=UPI00161699E9|nr:protein abrupt-like isoform X5 [Vespa mandarinia]XP_043682063.1 protein abrupt-like isoform X4 [Vespula pensylvanica]XP_046828503.1 protein abrupt isoform X5 [Vespa crabro]XP_050865939.1 protein abrupt-like isoform X3 [Vespula vulgaris]